MIDQIALNELFTDSKDSSVEKISEDIYKIDGEVIEVLDLNPDLKTLKFRHNHNTHEVQFKNELDFTLDKMGIKRSFDAVNTDIKAPMPGKVIAIKVKPGDQVKKGDALLILEAMKMENVLKAQHDCEIKTVLVEELNNVEKNQLLIELSV
ncbi:acetyl-CoA carboxylase biotin carboxyl carrier protein subunit [Putridiphycobacter roseus]|uniref:Acetyl-CoA carboxylase biotin carboxyl carrier protein subunit n=1 Tax=Putridiphycobacter roseus TaxID=2219161 RepID=A0A2W1NNU5_9FLAO|nr:acetyl-CoA carboxylase biotin carboxyl carrier protein subunit [Putridiphycobacter roseus]PZE16278.1 acetyl-CoA carboxylase biotin carboxyl carrier protein subunit [Putridiphycobacter roseus]